MRLAKSLPIYTVTSFLVAGIPFLLLPVLTEYLETSDYGVLSLLSASTNVLFAIIGLGTAQAVGLEFFKLSKSEYKHYVPSAFRNSLISFVVIYALLFLFSNQIAASFGIPRKWLLIIPFISFSLIFITSAMGYLRNIDKPLTYGAFSVLRSSVEIGLTLTFVILLAMNFEGRMLSWLIVALTGMTIALFYFRSQKLLSFKKMSKAYSFSALTFGIPLIPEQLCIFALNMSDRFFIAKMEALDQVGIYSVGSQIGLIISILLMSFMKGFTPYFMRTLANITEYQKLRIVKITYLFIIGLFTAVIALSFAAPLIFKFFNKSYASGSQYVFWIGLGFFFWSFYAFAQRYIMFVKKSRILMVLALIAICINFILNYLLIKEFGTIGAAYATVISYATLGVMGLVMANKVYPMPWFKLKKVLRAKL